MNEKYVHRSQRPTGAHLYEDLLGLRVGFDGFAAIPTTAIDPPHRAASPAVPALIGSGSPSSCLLKVCDLLEFTEEIGVVLREMTDYARIAEQACDVSSGQHEV